MGGMIRRSTILAALAAAAVASAGAPVVAQAQPAATVRVGTQALALCAQAPLAYCGSLPVALDQSRPDSPLIDIAFRWYPASSPAAGGARHTVVPVEGGPGYPSIESVSYQSLGANSGYSAMYGALLEHSNMLAVDNRGTGESAPLELPGAAALLRSHRQRSFPPGRRRLREKTQPPLEVLRRRLGACLRPVRLGGGRAGHGGCHQVAGTAQGRPLR